METPKTARETLYSILPLEWYIVQLGKRERFPPKGGFLFFLFPPFLLGVWYTNLNPPYGVHLNTLPPIFTIYIFSLTATF